MAAPTPPTQPGTELYAACEGVLAARSVVRHVHATGDRSSIPLAWHELDLAGDRLRPLLAAVGRRALHRDLTIALNSHGNPCVRFASDRWFRGSAGHRLPPRPKVLTPPEPAPEPTPELVHEAEVRAAIVAYASARGQSWPVQRARETALVRALRHYGGACVHDGRLYAADEFHELHVRPAPHTPDFHVSLNRAVVQRRLGSPARGSDSNGRRRTHVHDESPTPAEST